VKKFALVTLPSITSLLIVYLLPYGTWASIAGLPTHPLVVHAVVVLLPLISLGLLFSTWKIHLFERFHLLAIVSVTITTLSAMVAKSSGDSLSAAVGLPEEHAEWGNNLVPLAAALVLATILLALFTIYLRSDFLIRIFRPLVALLSVATIALTILVGHSGAEAVWKDRYASAKVPLALSLDQYTAEEVSRHNSATDCWTIVDGFVYDVTTFTRRHPGGSKNIEKMCGVNSTEDYLDEHDGEREPREWLESLKIGSLK
jgi:uncharacterized membrane protein